MSWLNLNQSLSGLKGQFKNLANEVFSEGIVEDTDPFTELSGANDKIKELQNLCASQDVEIKTLRRQNATFHQEKLDALTKNNGESSGKAPKESVPQNEDESSWFWDPPDADSSTPAKNTNAEKQKLTAQIVALEAEVSDLKSKQNSENEDSNQVRELKVQLEALKNENASLALSLEDLDSQHQMAIDEVIKLKKDLQTNYDILQKKHESLEKENAEFKTRLKEREAEKDAGFKELSETNLKLISDLKTMHHKFDNLEKKHNLLEENTEKFQEDNLELSEENFKLQEECARQQHDLEELQKKHQPQVKNSENHVPNEKYRELEDKFLDLEKKFAETVPKKSVSGVKHDSSAQKVIAKLKFEIVELQNKLNTNEEIKRLNLEIDHLNKEVAVLSIKLHEFIPCTAMRQLIDKYMAPDFPAIKNYLNNTCKDLLEYTDLCLKNYSDLRKKNESLEFRASEDSRIINNLQSSVDEMTADIEILNGDIAHYSHQSSEQKKNNDFLIAEIGALKSVSKLEPILEHNEEHLEKLQNELEDCSNLNKSFEVELDNSEKQLHKVEMQKKKLEEELNFIKEELKHTKEEVERLRTDSNDSIDDKTLALTQQKLSETQSDLEKLKSGFHSVSVENEKHKIDLTILDNDKILLMREISELRANVQTKSIIEDYAKKIEAEKTDLEIKLCHLSEMENMVETLHKENEALKVRIASLDEMSETHDNLIQEELIQSKNNSLESAKQLADKEKELIVLKSNMLALENNAKEALKDRNGLIKDLTECYIKLTDGECDQPVESRQDNLQVIVKHIIGTVERIRQSSVDRGNAIKSYTAELKTSSDEINEIKEVCNDLRNELQKRDLEISQSKDAINHHIADIKQKDVEIAELNKTCSNLNQEIQVVKEELSNKCLTLAEALESAGEKETKILENSMLIEEINKIKEDFCVVKAQKDKLLIEREERAKNEISEVSELKKELTKKDDDIHQQNEELEKITISFNQLKTDYDNLVSKQENFKLEAIAADKLTLDKHVKSIEEKEEKINILNDSLTRIQNELEELKLQTANNPTVENVSSEEDYLALKTNFEVIEKQKNEAHLQIEHLTSEVLLLEAKFKNLVVEDDTKVGALSELENYKSEADSKLEQLNTEKNELINLVTQKHQESITYHAEIQRLNAVLFTENEKYKDLEKLIAQLKESHQTAGDQASSSDTDQLNKLLRDKTDRCLQLEGILDEIRQAGITPDELERLREKNQFLVEKCDVLGKNLVMEQVNAKQIAQEKIQIAEKEQSLSRELERLRQHLLEMEEEHTKDLVLAEHKWQEAQAKLTSAEEKVKHSTTLYTSNSIRANQEVETLRTQIKLVEKQRDEIQSQLGQSEDRNSKNLAALTNLQCVLEQFQMDKEHEGAAAAGRIRRDLEASRDEVLTLQRQVEELEEKLRDSSSGLRAASRLSANLDARAAQLQEARDNAAKLEDELGLWKNKYRDAVSNQQDKVDKSLVKNLLMGYIHTANNQRPGDRIQVLRLLSTVLDFDQSECERAGLGKAESSNQGTADSLAQEFIKFLEKESRPQLKIGLPNLLHLGQAQGSNSPGLSTKWSPNNLSQSRAAGSPQLGTATKPLIPVPIIPLTMDNPILANASSSPVTAVNATNPNTESHAQPGNAVLNNAFGGFSLFTPIANPDMAVNQTRNSEGAILKNVLKDA